MTADILAATTALNTAVGTLEDATDALAAAITDGEAALVASGLAKTAHLAAGGEVDIAEYLAVVSAEIALDEALVADPKVTDTITAATGTLDAAVTDLVVLTDALPAAITAGEAALIASAAAKIAHTDAGGAEADAAYATVVTKEGDLNTALTAVPKVTGTITAATTALNDAVTPLEDATDALAAAITAGDAAIVASGLAKTAHTDAGGAVTDAEYAAVVTAEDVLTDALTAVPKVTGDITDATTDLDNAVIALAAETAPLALDVAIAAGGDAIVASDLALAAYADAGGLEVGLEYDAVVAADAALDTLLLEGTNTAAIVAATTTLNDAVAALVVLTGLLTTYDMILPLQDGWTLISTNGWIDSETSAWEGSVNLTYKYTGVAFVEADFADLKPVEALYVKTLGGGWAGLNYLDAAPGMSAKELVEGWNLISSGAIADAGAVLSPLQDIGNQGTGLTTLVSQDVYNFNTGDWYIDASTWASVTGDMNPFDGYWIYMNAAKSFGVILQ